jgi:hypothetical protein
MTSRFDTRCEFCCSLQLTAVRTQGISQGKGGDTSEQFGKMHDRFTERPASTRRFVSNNPVKLPWHDELVAQLNSEVVDENVANEFTVKFCCTGVAAA